MVRLSRTIFAAIVLACTLPAFAAAGRVECAALRSKMLARPVRYCALLPPSFDREPTRKYPVLYWLHGLGGNAETFVDAGGWALLEQLRDTGKIGEFVVITPDGDTTFYINSRDGRRPYESFFVQEFMPAMERHYRVRAGRESRAISGVSMGGYGALHLAFAHPQLFGSVTAHSAALIDRISPAILTGGGFRFLNVAFGDPVDTQYWEKNNPLRMAERAAGLATLKIYFDCGLQDDYGFDTGARALERVLSGRKIAHEFHLYPGHHDWQYVAQHLGASLEFHAKVFAGK
jgi:S-formylglutathione hydrolase FrmB